MSQGRFATLTFERDITAPVAALWQAWFNPAARALWGSPTPSVTVEFIETATAVGGREVSLCKVNGQPDIRVEAIWLVLEPERRSVNSEVVSCEGHTQAAALVTADFAGDGPSSRLTVTVQLSLLAEDMEQGYRQGFGAAMGNLADVAERTMLIERVIEAPAAAIWAAWTDPKALPQWWGPDGFSCRTRRIDLSGGGEWVFDMIGPDGTVWPNHHRYLRMETERAIDYTLLWGESGPKHADASVRFEDLGGRTKVTLSMIFVTAEEYETAKGVGAVELGLQTLGKLARFIGAD